MAPLTPGPSHPPFAAVLRCAARLRCTRSNPYAAAPKTPGLALRPRYDFGRKGPGDGKRFSGRTFCAFCPSSPGEKSRPVGQRIAGRCCAGWARQQDPLEQLRLQAGRAQKLLSKPAGDSTARPRARGYGWARAMTPCGAGRLTLVRAPRLDLSLLAARCVDRFCEKKALSRR